MQASVRRLVAIVAVLLALPAVADVAVPAPGASPRVDAIKKAGVLRVGVLANAPWLVENTSGGGEAWSGPAWLLANEYAKRLNVKLEAVPVSHETKVPVLASNQVDISVTPLAETAERLKVVDFIIYSNTSVCMFGLAANPEVRAIEIRRRSQSRRHHDRVLHGRRRGGLGEGALSEGAVARRRRVRRGAGRRGDGQARRRGADQPRAVGRDGPQADCARPCCRRRTTARTARKRRRPSAWRSTRTSRRSWRGRAPSKRKWKASSRRTRRASSTR